jgi:hypothetical protein
MKLLTDRLLWDQRKHKHKQDTDDDHIRSKHVCWKLIKLCKRLLILMIYAVFEMGRYIPVYHTGTIFVPEFHSDIFILYYMALFYLFQFF